MTELSPIEIKIPGPCANLQVTEFLTLRTGWALVSPGVSIELLGTREDIC